MIQVKVKPVGDGSVDQHIVVLEDKDSGGGAPVEIFRVRDDHTLAAPGETMVVLKKDDADHLARMIAWVVRETDRHVNTQTSRGNLFTAYDITKLVRESIGTVIKIPHNTVRDIVHAMFQLDPAFNEYYSRTVVDIGVSPNPHVFHPYDVDANKYKPECPPPAPSPANAGGYATIVRRVANLLRPRRD